MAQKPSIPKGTRDFSPLEMARRNYIFDTIKSVFSLYGFQQIETPAMENLSTLMGKYGEEGEICVNGPTVMMGYINNDKETDKVLIRHEDNRVWLHTGDLGYRDKKGEFFFSSRLKRMIVSSGYNIYPGQIEEILNAHPLIKNSVAVGVPHPYKKEVVKAYIVLKKTIELIRFSISSEISVLYLIFSEVTGMT